MPIIQREVLVLLRLVDNRLCADCDAPLGETTISASCTYRTWICENCAGVHRLNRALGNLKFAQESWSESEVKLFFM